MSSDGKWLLSNELLEKVFHAIEGEDPMVFCDGRPMRRSEMRALVKADMARFAAMDAENTKLRTEVAAAKEAAQRAAAKHQWWTRWNQQFRQWQERNEQAISESQAELRAKQRQRKDDKMVRELMARIEEKQRAHRAIAGGYVLDYILERLTDHQYIEWMFACAEHGLACPI